MNGGRELRCERKIGRQGEKADGHDVVKEEGDNFPQEFKWRKTGGMERARETDLKIWSGLAVLP